MKFFLPVLISMLSAALGIFFIYKGIDRHFLSPCTAFTQNSTFSSNYSQLITTLCDSGFLFIVGIIEIVAGILLIFPKTRFGGILLIMPVIITIFLFHLMIDNRPFELIQSGIPLAATLLIFASHQKNLKLIMAR